MKRQLAPRRSLLALALGVAISSLIASVDACTVFVLTDSRHALFCNNEDHPNPNTKIWFQPAGDGYLGAVYVGVETGWAQGGLNSAGLAFDWVADFEGKWEQHELPRVRANPSQRMLETCATVQDAIRFYRTYWEPGFNYARILLADKTGCSALISAKDNRLEVEQQQQSRGFGAGWRTLEPALAKHPKPTVAQGFKILRACRQGGFCTTKYSNIFDLKSGEIFLYYKPKQNDEAKLNLATELKKGVHYYDMPQIRQQLAQAPRVSPLTMQRFPLDQAVAIADPEPNITAHLEQLIREASAGKSQADHFTPEMWKRISVLAPSSQTDLFRYGQLNSLTLLVRNEEGDLRTYYYRADFANATVLQQFVLNKQDKLASGNLWVDAIWKAHANTQKR